MRMAQKVSITNVLNAGLAHGRGEYVARADSDDIWLPMRLETQLKLMEQPENMDVGVCGGNCLLIDAQGHLIGTKEFPQSHEECVRAFWYRNPICHPSALIRRRCFEEYGKYDEAFNFAEDLELWMRFGQGFRLANVPEFLICYRIAGANTTLKKQKAVIGATLRARHRAASCYGYSIGLGGRVALGLTWGMQWLPGAVVIRLFNDVFLKCCSWLWRTQPSGTARLGKPECESDKKVIALRATHP